MQVFRPSVFAALLLALFVPLSAPATAQSTTAYTIGVETTEYFPIYAYRDSQYVGYSRDLLDAFAAKKGYTFNYVALPVLRLFVDYLADGSKLDFKFPDNPQWRTDIKKDKPITYSKPAFESVEGGMVLPDRVGKGVGTIKVLGTIRGFTPWPYQDAIDARKIVPESSDNLSSLVQKGMAGRVDAIFINKDIAEYHLVNELKKPGALVMDKGLPNNDVAYLLSTRKYPKVIEEFNAFLESEQALVAQLKAKHKLH